MQAFVRSTWVSICGLLGMLFTLTLDRLRNWGYAQGLVSGIYKEGTRVCSHGSKAGQVSTAVTTPVTIYLAVRVYIPE